MSRITIISDDKTEFIGKRVECAYTRCDNEFILTRRHFYQHRIFPCKIDNQPDCDICSKNYINTHLKDFIQKSEINEIIYGKSTKYKYSPRVRLEKAITKFKSTDYGYTQCIYNDMLAIYKKWITCKMAFPNKTILWHEIPDYSAMIKF